MKAYIGSILIIGLLHFEAVYAVSNSLNIEDFLIKVQIQSPEILVEKSTKEEFKARSQGVRIPPPMVGFMNMKDTGGNNQGIEVIQEVPFPTKITKEQELRDLEAQVQNAQFTYKKNEVLLEARKAYFEFWRVFENKKILEEKLVWLNNHVRLSRSIARSDSSGQIHLLAMESELDQLDNEILEVRAELVEKINNLKTFVPDLQTENLVPESSPKLDMILLEKNQKSFLVDLKESDYQAAISAREFKKQSYLPDFVLRYRSYNGNQMSSSNEEIMVGVTLPFLFFWQPHSEIAEASAKQKRAEIEVFKAKLNIETQLKSLGEKSEAIGRQLQNFKDKLIPRARKRMKLVENLTVRTMEGLDEHRMVMFDYLELRQKEINSKFEFEKNNIEILKIVNYQKDKL